MNLTSIMRYLQESLPESKRRAGTYRDLEMCGSRGGYWCPSVSFVRDPRCSIEIPLIIKTFLGGRSQWLAGKVEPESALAWTGQVRRVPDRKCWKCF